MTCSKTTEEEQYFYLKKQLRKYVRQFPSSSARELYKTNRRCLWIKAWIGCGIIFADPVDNDNNETSTSTSATPEALCWFEELVLLFETLAAVAAVAVAAESVTDDTINVLLPLAPPPSVASAPAAAIATTIVAIATTTLTTVDFFIDVHNVEDDNIILYLVWFR